MTDIKETTPITKELVFFSLPLLGSAIMITIVMYVDTLMLGYFKTTEIVGLYNAAHPLARFISEPLAALLLEIEKRSGINATPIKKLLRRFL